MKCFIARHGQDNDSVRGGWSKGKLTDIGVCQSIELAEEIVANIERYNIGRIFASDIVRAKQTAEIIANKLNLSVELIPEFREVNNGDLAGMDNELADEKYPNLYWRKLDLDEHYPNGESPKEFYERVSNAWIKFESSLNGYDKNVLLITHGGVINVIKCINNGTKYSNKEKFQSIPSAKIALKIEM